MASDKEIVVYIHKNPNTGEVFYVGIGRSKRPYHTIQRSEFWKRYVQKHGSPVIEIVDRPSTWDEAKRLECKLIQNYGRRDLGLGSLVNMTDGGDGVLGRPLSEKGKESLRQYHLGRPKSIAAREKMSKAKTGLSYPKLSARKPIALYDRYGNRLKVYQTTREVLVDGFNPLMAGRMAHSKTAFRTTCRHYFVAVSDEICPAYLEIRKELANTKRVFSIDALRNITIAAQNRYQ